MSDIAWAIIIVVAMLLSAPAWVPLLFMVGGLLIAGVLLVCTFVFIAIVEFCEGVARAWRSGKQKPR